MTRTPLKLMATALAATIVVPLANAGDSQDAYNLGTLWPLSVEGVDIEYSSSGNPQMLCIELGEEETDEAARTLCQAPKSIRSRVVGESITFHSAPKPLPVGADGAFLYFVQLADTVPSNPSYSPSPVSTAVSCVGIIQEGGELAGIWVGDDFVLYTNCPSALDAFFLD